MFEIKGKVALVTGASSGIGLAYVKALLQNGCKGVSLIDINEKSGCDALEQLRREFGEARVIFLKVDVTVKSELARAFEDTVRAFKQLDIVVNNAGTFDESDIDKLINLNLTAVVRGTKLALEEYLPKYKSGEEGIIVNTASTTGLMYFTPAPIYSTTKHGVVALGKCFGANYDKTKIKILTICPGSTETPLLRLGLATFDEQELKNFIEINEPPQPTKYLGKAIVTAIKEGSNGSVWVCDRKELYEVVVEPVLK